MNMAVAPSRMVDSALQRMQAAYLRLPRCGRCEATRQRARVRKSENGIFAVVVRIRQSRPGSPPDKPATALGPLQVPPSGSLQQAH